MKGRKPSFLSQAFGRLPIRHKLMAIILGITFASLVTALVVGALGQYLSLRAEKEGQLEIMADFTAKNVASALDFLDPKSAQESLQALAFDPSIHLACVYDGEDTLFASYIAENAYEEAHLCPTKYKDVPRKNKVSEIYSNIRVRMGQNNIGAVTLLYDMTTAHIRFFWATMMGLFILMVALLIAYGLANIVQRVISRPVTELAEAAHRFVGHEDFSIRVEKTTDDELGHMVEAFNRMVEKMKERDEIIVQAREDAINANKMKSEFLANMSHELRTPLNSIIGMTRILIESDNINPDNRDTATTVYKSSTNLLDIVNDILDISKIEAGSIVLEKIGFDLRDTITSLTEAMAPLASKRGVSLVYNIHNENIPYLVGDPLRVSRILTNLISNAIKYTDQGIVSINIVMNDGSAGSLAIENENGISTSIQSGHPPSGSVEICCAVADTGIGIVRDKLGAIFDKFSQADASTTRKYGGTGLGLAITKELVEMMGGQIGVDSEVGKGSVFWFRIPFETTDKLDDDLKNKRRRKGERTKKIGDDKRIPSREARLLLAEDHILNQDFMKKLLPRMGFVHFDIVDNGRRVVEAVMESEYDLILMDCHMPEKSGYEATMDIREYEKTINRRIPIVAITADAMKGTQEKCILAGMDDYISKPVDSDELRDLLEQWFIFDAVKKKDKQREEKPQAPVLPASDSVDLSALMEHATLDEIAGFIKVFLEQSQGSLDRLAEHCTEGEDQKWVESAHKLKGGAGMLGAKKLYDICAEAQQMETASADERREMLGRILGEYDNVKAYVGQVVSRQTGGAQGA